MTDSATSAIRTPDDTADSDAPMPIDPAAAAPWYARPINISLMIACAAAVVYLRVFQQHFIGLDDGGFVYENPFVMNGFTLEGLKFAFGPENTSSYHPLMWLSHMLDVTLFGASENVRPVGHKAHNLLLHVANSVLLFHVIRNLSKQLWPAAVIALIWAVHPMRVEVVAWVAERKELLSMFFGMLTLLAYTHYVARRSIARYALVVLLFILTLLSKPMLVTLPCVMLLFDIWPLRRVNGDDSRARLRSVGQLVVEKLPMVPLIVASSWMTILVTRSSGTLQAVSENDSLLLRIQNSIVAYAWYLQKFFWPTNLGVYYEYRIWPLPQVLISAAVLAVITGVCIVWAKKRPYLIIGWLYFLGTLVPVIGIVKVGAQSYADRYSYVTHVGLLIMIVFAAADVLASRTKEASPGRARVGIAATGIFALALMVGTVRQVCFWDNTLTLFKHTTAVSPGNPLALSIYGKALMHNGDIEEAKQYLSRSIEIDARRADPLASVGFIFVQEGKFDEAMEAFEMATKVEPDSPLGWVNLGASYLRKGSLEAQPVLEKAIELDPGLAISRYNLGRVFDELRHDPQGALPHYAQAVTLEPNEPRFRRNLACMQIAVGAYADARNQLEQAQRLKSDDKIVERALAYITQLAKTPLPDQGPATDPVFRLGLLRESVMLDAKGSAAAYTRVIEAYPQFALAHQHLGLSRLVLEDFDGARVALVRAKQLAPDDAITAQALAYLERAAAERNARPSPPMPSPQ